MRLLKEIENTVNPNKGGGMSESIVYVVLIVAVVFLKFNDVDVPKELYLGMGAMIGYITNKEKVK